MYEHTVEIYVYMYIYIYTCTHIHIRMQVLLDLFVYTQRDFGEEHGSSTASGALHRNCGLAMKIGVPDKTTNA